MFYPNLVQGQIQESRPLGQPPRELLADLTDTLKSQVLIIHQVDQDIK